MVGSQAGLCYDNPPGAMIWTAISRRTSEVAFDHHAWGEKGNEQQRSQHLWQPTCCGFRHHRRPRLQWWTSNSFHIYTLIQWQWMGVGPSVLLRCGFRTQNSSQCEKLHGHKLRERSEQEGNPWLTYIPTANLEFSHTHHPHHLSRPRIFFPLKGTLPIGLISYFTLCSVMSVPS